MSARNPTAFRLGGLDIDGISRRSG